jgi:hypothetical protein
LGIKDSIAILLSNGLIVHAFNVYELAEMAKKTGPIIHYLLGKGRLLGKRSAEVRP